MKKIILLFLAVTVIATSGTAQAVPTLYDWAFYVDGTTYQNFNADTMPTSGTLTNGLGSLNFTTAAAGTHTFIAFFDHEIDEAINTFFNEVGSVSGAPVAGQSWQIDDPFNGSIYGNTLAGSLDNSNSVASPEDVSMAIGWNFVLTAGETASIDLLLSSTAPDGGLYLVQSDPDSQESIYYSSSMLITGGGGPEPVPEPSTILLLGVGLSGLFLAGARRTRK